MAFAFFYDMLAQADINSMVFFKLAKKQEKTSLWKFLIELGLQFTLPHMKRRHNKNLPAELWKDIENILYAHLE